MSQWTTTPHAYVTACTSICLLLNVDSFNMRRAREGMADLGRDLESGLAALRISPAYLLSSTSKRNRIGEQTNSTATITRLCTSLHMTQENQDSHLDVIIRLPAPVPPRRGVVHGTSVQCPDSNRGGASYKRQRQPHSHELPACVPHLSEVWVVVHLEIGDVGCDGGGQLAGREAHGRHVVHALCTEGERN